MIDRPTCSVTRRISRLMGCRASLAVTAADGDAEDLADEALHLLRHLEARWSRFLSESDVSRLNRAGGRAVVVDASTVELVAAMARGVRATAGAFDPTLVGAIVGLGYGPAWVDGAERCSRAHPRTEALTDWVDETTVDVEARVIALPPGVGLDPGAIGKGLAGDIVARSLAGEGADVHVVLGGDVRTTAPAMIGIGAPDRSDRLVDRIAVASGGVATSGTARRWIDPSGRIVHHVLDPSTATPITGEIVQVSVAAANGADAEVWATAALVAGVRDVADHLDRVGVGVLAVDRNGAVAANAAWRSLRVEAVAAGQVTG